MAGVVNSPSSVGQLGDVVGGRFGCCPQIGVVRYVVTGRRDSMATDGSRSNGGDGGHPLSCGHWERTVRVPVFFDTFYIL